MSDTVSSTSINMQGTIAKQKDMFPVSKPKLEPSPAAQSFRSIRSRMGLTQLQAAKKLGVSPATISAWEMGRSEIPDGAERRLAGGRLDQWLDAAVEAAMRIEARMVWPLVGFALGVVSGMGIGALVLA